MIYHWRINYKSQITKSPFSMVEKILIYERDAFFALNGSDSAFLDRFMWIFTGKAVWLPLAFWSCWFWSIKRTGASHYWSCWRSYWSLRCATSLPLTSVSLSSPVSARLTILILWIRWKLFSDTAGGLLDLFPAMLRTLSVSRLLWHWSCGISCSAGQSFSGRLLLLIHGFISGSLHFGYRAGSHFGCVLGYLVYRLYSFSRSKLLPVQVNNGGTTVLEETYPISSSMQYMWRSDYYRF